MCGKLYLPVQFAFSLVQPGTAMSEYSEILTSTFNFLSDDDISEIGIALKQELDDSLFARAQMQKFAMVLDSFGLRITSTLLLGITKKGSKSDAILVARESAKSRFDQSREVRLQKMRAVVNAPISSNAKASESIDTHYHDKAEKIDQMAADVKAISERLKWMVSTIDSERQLTRYRLGQQSSTPIESGPAPKKEMVSAVVSQLAGQYRNTATRIETPDLVRSVSEDPLDL